MRPLSPEEVAARTLQAMAERQFLVILPKSFYLASFLKAYVQYVANVHFRFLSPMPLDFLSLGMKTFQNQCGALFTIKTRST